MLQVFSKKSFLRFTYNKALKAVPRFARHWTASNSAFAAQIVCAVSSCPLALRYAADTTSLIEGKS